MSTRSSRPSRDVQQLLTLSEALAKSGSRLEDIYWESLLATQLTRHLLGKKNRTVEHALDHLLRTNVNAYEILVEQAETLSESATLVHEGMEYDALLFSAPMVAWTRYQLPDGDLSGEQRQALGEQLARHIVAEGAALALVPRLVAFDQMPQSFQETRVWTQRLAMQALQASDEACPLHPAADDNNMLADARFLVGAIVVPKGSALFRWQSDKGDPTVLREQAVAAWTAAGGEVLAPVFTGCHVEHLPPDAYYLNSREADRHIRPLALKAAVTWLHTAANLPGDQLRAVIVACGEAAPEEYRVGFCTQQSNDVVYGCIWPVLSKDEAAGASEESEGIDVPDEIAALLKELGVGEVRRLPGLYPLEFCEDCGAPYFPNPLGEMLHPELPEETDMTPMQFH